MAASTSGEISVAYVTELVDGPALGDVTRVDELGEEKVEVAMVIGNKAASKLLQV